MAGRKTTNKEKIEKAKKELETLSAILGEILDDTMNQTEAARKLGITPQEFRNETIGNFTNYVKKKNILTEDDILVYLKDMETPLDRIAKDMFNITDKNKLLIIEIEDPEDFIHVMKETLTEKEFYVMSLRYGFDGEPMTYQKIGEQIGTQIERVRQIINKSLRKLRHPSRSRRLFPNYPKYTKALQTYKTTERIYLTMESEYINASTECKRMLHNIELAKITPELKEQFEKLFYLEDIPEIPDEWIASFHDLHITSVYDYLSADEEKIKEMQDICPGFSITEMEKILDVKPPITRKELCCMRFPLTETEISARAFNALRRSGINTLGQLTQLTESNLKKVRNLGPKCCGEIKELLEKYNLQLSEK